MICSCHPASDWRDPWCHPTSEWLGDHEWISPSLGAMLDHNTLKLGDILIMLLWRWVTWSITSNWNKCDIIDHVTHWINDFMQSSLLLWGPFFSLSALIFSCQWVRQNWDIDKTRNRAAIRAKKNPDNLTVLKLLVSVKFSKYFYFIMPLYSTLDSHFFPNF